MTTIAMPKHRRPDWPMDGRNATKLEEIRNKHCPPPPMPRHAVNAGVVVIDSSQANRLPTGHVLLGNVAGHTDADLAGVAGYCSRHWGYLVHRFPDGTASVDLWND